MTDATVMLVGALGKAGGIVVAALVVVWLRHLWKKDQEEGRPRSKVGVKEDAGAAAPPPKLYLPDWLPRN